MFQKLLVIDCRGHILGRLAATIAKQLLCGQPVVAVRCEEIHMSGTIQQKQLQFMAFLRKRTNTNPRRGPFHQRSPSEILKRAIRGMLPRHCKRGSLALKRLSAFEGVPPKYQKVKRLVIPRALRLFCHRPNCPYTELGRLSARVGWKHLSTIKRYEAERKIRSNAYYQEKRAVEQLKQQAFQNVKNQLSTEIELLKGYGYRY